MRCSGISEETISRGFSEAVNARIKTLFPTGVPTTCMANVGSGFQLQLSQFGEFNEPLPMESSPIRSGRILHPELPIEGKQQSPVMVSASGMSSIRALGVF
jgi:hypothetical protein